MDVGKIYNLDAREFIDGLETGSVHVMMTDPPYAIANKTEFTVGKGKNKRIVRPADFGEWDYFESEETFETFTRAWVAKVKRVLHPKGSFYCWFAKQRISWLWNLCKEFGLTPRDIITWHKPNAQPLYRKFGYQSATEFMLFATAESSATFFNWQLGYKHNHVEHASVPSVHRLHPTEKPVAVLYPWLQYSSPYDSLVVDPFCGSGSTLEAAKTIGRKWMGNDLSSEHFAKATKRMAHVQENPLLIQLEKSAHFRQAQRRQQMCMEIP